MLSWRRSKKWHITAIAIILLIAIALFLNSRFQICAISFFTHSSSVSGFRVMTFNVNCTDSLAFTNECQGELIEFVQSEQPDILCIQEISYENHLKVKDELEQFYGVCDSLKIHKMWRPYFYSKYPIRNFRKYKCEGDLLADIISMGFTLTPNEITTIHHIQEQSSILSAEFEVMPNKWVAVFSGHLQSSAYSTARRSMDSDQNWFDGISLYWRNYKRKVIQKR